MGRAGSSHRAVLVPSGRGRTGLGWACTWNWSAGRGCPMVSDTHYFGDASRRPYCWKLACFLQDSCSFLNYNTSTESSIMGFLEEEEGLLAHVPLADEANSMIGDHALLDAGYTHRGPLWAAYRDALCVLAAGGALGHWRLAINNKLSIIKGQIIKIDSYVLIFVTLLTVSRRPRR